MQDGAVVPFRVQMTRASSVNAVAMRWWWRASQPEFVVAAPKVLHERVTAHNHACGVVAFESAHRTEAGLEPAVV